MVGQGNLSHPMKGLREPTFPNPVRCSHRSFPAPALTGPDVLLLAVSLIPASLNIPRCDSSFFVRLPVKIVTIHVHALAYQSHLSLVTFPTWSPFASCGNALQEPSMGDNTYLRYKAYFIIIIKTIHKTETC